MEERRAAPPPTVRVKQSPKGAAGDPLKVDWSKATSGGEWWMTIGYPAARKAEARFAQDGEYLYIRLSEDANPEPLANDPGVWSGDHWELFFTAERGTKSCRQIGITPAGKHLGLAHGESSGTWESGVKVISETGVNSWKVSLAFPLVRLLPGGVKPGQTIYINMFRGYGGIGCDALAWSPTFENNFLSPDRMGEIILE
jgi:hypothetical protein